MPVARMASIAVKYVGFRKYEIVGKEFGSS
jgi:hypothetical protein